MTDFPLDVKIKEGNNKKQTRENLEMSRNQKIKFYLKLRAKSLKFAAKERIKRAKKLLKWEFYEDCLVAILKFFIRRNPISPFYALWRSLFTLKKKGSFKHSFIRSDKYFSSHHPFVSAFGSFVFLFLIISGVFYFVFNRNSNDAAAWWDSSWFYRKQVAVNNVDGDLTDFQVSFTFDSASLISKGKMKSDCSDVRFVGLDGENFSFWINEDEGDCNTSATKAWIKVSDVFEGDGATKFYLYYGNETAGDVQNAEETFLFFDDFEDSSRSASLWEQANHGGGEVGQWVVANGYVQLEEGGNGPAAISLAKFDDLDDYVVEAKTMHIVAAGNAMGLVARGSLAGNYYHQEIDQDNLGLYRFDGWAFNELSTSSTFTVVADTWYKARLKVLGSNISAESVSHGETLSVVDATYSSGRPGFQVYQETARFDDFIVRKATTTDPTLAFSAPEEKSPAPVAYWTFNEGRGDTAHDSSSFSHDGTVHGASWKNEDECKSGNCLSFDGEGDYVEIADSDALDLEDELTVEAWVKPKSVNASLQTIVSKTQESVVPTKIYRSVGPGKTSALATGSGSTLQVLGDRAIFQSALPDNVGVGDVIQYDANDDGIIDTNDALAFIHERVDGKEYIVKKANGKESPIQVDSDEDWSVFRAYTKLSSAQKGVENVDIDGDLQNFDTWVDNRDIVTTNEQWNMVCYADAIDAYVDTGVYAGYGWTTSRGNYIRIYTPTGLDEVGTSQRHSGKYDEANGYMLSLDADGTNYRFGIRVDAQYIKLDGLQIKLVDDTASRYAIRYAHDYLYAEVEISNCIAKAFGAGAASGFVSDVNDEPEGVYILRNNVFEDFNNHGVISYGPDAEFYWYNNTAIDCATGFRSYEGDVTAKNNIAQGATDGFVGTFNTDSDYNISDLVADAPGANSKNEETVIFADAASSDFHLDPADTVAGNAGTDLSADLIAPFSDELDGSERAFGDSWDIGADEFRPTEIFRSVGPGSTTALATGEDNTMSILGGVAEFTVSLPENVGVGDVIQYDDDSDGDVDGDDSVVFIHKRFSSNSFQVRTSDGSMPVGVRADQDWSVFRAYTSLYDAENGIENTGIDSDLRAFESWSSNKNLVSANQMWNIACYADAVDTARASFYGWTTGRNQGIKIFTPNKKSEVGQSQRHEGVWTDEAYSLVAPTGNNSLSLGSNYMEVDGLQVSNEGTASGDDLIDFYGYIAQRGVISNNILKGGSYGISGNTLSASAGGNKIFNNIIYNTKTSGIAFGHSTNDGFVGCEIYNNIVYDCNQGNYSYRGGIRAGTATDHIVKNNLTFNNFNSDIYTSGIEEYNVSSDGTAVGTGSLANRTITDNIAPGVGDWVVAKSLTVGSEDLRLVAVSGNDAIDTGTQISGRNNLASDIQGDERSDGNWDMGADEANATEIFRSVGVGSESALVSGGAIEMSIASSVATFTDNLPANVGVGDVIEYDLDADGDIDASDLVMFIHERYSGRSYLVKKVDGSAASDLADVTNWNLFRAYTSLFNAEKGEENEGIDADLRDFDIWANGKNLTTVGEKWSIACYADAVDVTPVEILGWTLSKRNSIRVFAPSKFSEVGVSQRHQGRWTGDGYQLVVPDAVNDHALLVGDDADYAVIDGLQVSQGNSTKYGIMKSSYAPDVVIENSIAKGGNTGIYIGGQGGDRTIVRGNIVYDTQVGGISVRQTIDVTKSAIYGNTVYNCNQTNSSWRGGIGSIAHNLPIYNNIAWDNGVEDFADQADNSAEGNFNFSKDDTAPGEQSIHGDADGKTPDFVSTTSGSEDLHLQTSSDAIGKGMNYYAEIQFDVDGQERPKAPAAWDMGADHVSLESNEQNYSIGLGFDTPTTKFVSEGEELRFSTMSEVATADEWIHIAYQRDLENEYFYINGKRKESRELDGLLSSNSGKIFIGAKDSTGGNAFTGLLDEVRIFPYARMDTEIKSDYVAGRVAAPVPEGISAAFGNKSDSWMSDGLVGYWKMDEASWDGTAKEVMDASGSGNDGVAQNGVSTSAGKFGGGGDFDGISNSVSAGDVLSFERSDAFSFGFWCKRDSAGTRYETITNQNYSGLYRGYSIEFRADDTLRVSLISDWTASNQIVVETTEAFTDVTDWLFVTVSYDGSSEADGVKIYTDGKLAETTTSNDTLSDTMVSSSYINFSIGSRYNGAQYPFKGGIDEVRAYDRVLSAGEVNDLYRYAPGPVLELKMDEMEGQYLYNTSSSENKLDDATRGDSTTPSDADPVWVGSGKVNGGLEFDGIDAYTQIDNTTALTTLKSRGNATFATWFKIEDLDQDNQVLTHLYAGPLDREYMRYVNDGRINFLQAYGGAAQYSYTTLTLTDNDWHHLEVVYDGVNRLMYLDGKYKETVVSSYALSEMSGDPDLYIGARIAGGGYYFKGLLDEVKMYDYKRTARQVLEDMNGGASALKQPVLHLSLDEGYGVTAFDGSVFGHDGALTNGPTWRKDGIFGGSLEFDGADDYIQIDEHVFDHSRDNTIMMWAKIDTLGDNMFFSYVDAAGEFVNIGTAAGLSNELYVSRDNDNIKSRAAAAPDKDWHHWVFLFDSAVDANRYSIYQDGVDVSLDAAVSFGAPIVTSQLRIGGRLSTTTFDFDGKIDDVKIHDFALSEDEIKQEYRNGAKGIPSKGGPVLSVGGTDENWKTRGLVGHWKMDESSWNGTAGEVVDATGNGNDGTAAGGVTTTAAKFGKGGDFDGNDDFVNMGDVGIFDNQSEFTINYWVNLDDIDSDHATFWKGATNFGGSGDIALFFDDEETSSGRANVFTFITLHGGTYYRAVTDTNFVSADKWYMVTGVAKAGEALKIYIDGVNETDYTTSVLPSNFENSSNYSPLTFGAVSDNTRFLNGNMDDVRIYNRALSANEIKKFYLESAETVLHLKMDETSGTTAYDLSGSNNDGTITGATWNPIGKLNSALSFDGDGDYVSVANEGDYRFADGDFSYSAWVKMDSKTTDANVISKGYNYELRYDVGDDNWEFVIYDGGYQYAKYSQDNPTLNSWYHLLGVRAGGEVNIYVNGIKGETVDTAGTIIDSSNPVNIGRSNDGSRQFDGIIDDVKIYNHALSSREIAREYNGGKPAGHWKFDRGEGVQVDDWSGHGYHGAMTNMDDTEAWTDGKFNGALKFDGVDDYVNLGSLSYTKGQTQATYSFWVKTYSTEKDAVILSKGGWSTMPKFQLWRDDVASSGRTDVYTFMFDINAAFRLESQTGTAADTDWHHLVITLEMDTADGAKIYVDGILSDSEDTTGNLLIGTYDDLLFLGASENSGGVELDGQIDDLRIYGYALTVDEIRQVYNGGAAMKFE